MAYVDPDYAVSGATASADAYNILVDDVIDHEARIAGQAAAGVYLTRNSSQSISNSTYEAISWSAARHEITGDWWSSGTNVTVPTAAVPSGATILLEIDGQAFFNANGTGSRYIRFMLNGAIIDVQRTATADSGETTSVGHRVWAECSAADVITMEVKQNSGGSLGCAGASLAIKRIGVINP